MSSFAKFVDAVKAKNGNPCSLRSVFRSCSIRRRTGRRRATRLCPNRSLRRTRFFLFVLVVLLVLPATGTVRDGDDLEQTICAWTEGVKGWELPAAARQ